MLLTISDDAIADRGLTPDDLLAELALALYRAGKITIGHGCKMTNLPEIEFQRLLAAHGVDIRYPEDALQNDLDALRSGN